MSRGLLLSAVVCLAVAATDPGMTLKRPVYDAVVVLDVSQSMNVADYRIDGHPASRLAFAKAGLRRALAGLPCGSRIGWGVFAAYRVLLLTAPAEICANYGDLTALLDRIDNRMAWTNGSEVRKGVLNGIDAVRALPDKPALVFVTDGQEAPPIDPRLQMPQLHGRPGEVAGTLVGAGGDLPQPIPKSDPEGRPLGFWTKSEVVQAPGPGEQRSWLHEAHLVALAQQVGFRYRRMNVLGDLAAVLAQPDFARPQPTRVALGPLFAGLGLAGILGAILAPGLHPILTKWNRLIAR